MVAFPPVPCSGAGVGLRRGWFQGRGRTSCASGPLAPWRHAAAGVPGSVANAVGRGLASGFLSVPAPGSRRAARGFGRGPSALEAGAPVPGAARLTTVAASRGRPGGARTRAGCLLGGGRRPAAAGGAVAPQYKLPSQFRVAAAHRRKRPEGARSERNANEESHELEPPGGSNDTGLTPSFDFPCRAEPPPGSSEPAFPRSRLRVGGPTSERATGVPLSGRASAARDMWDLGNLAGFGSGRSART